MTTRAEMQRLLATAAVTIRDMRAAGLTAAAERLERCANARRGRDPARRAWSCRTSWCPWCSRPLLRRWMNGIRLWTGTDEAFTVTVPMPHELGDPREAVRALRRALRDFRDRQARKVGHRAWRKVAFGGIVGADMNAVIHIQPAGIPRQEIVAAMIRRWPGASIRHRDQPIAVDWSVEDRIALARIRRGAEPLRIVVAPQGQRPRAPWPGVMQDYQPLPVIVG